MYGVEEDDPCCIKSVEALMDYIDQIGFLPLFKNEIPGFSVEERTVAKYWWTENKERDPWEWREIIAGSGRLAYGKFFHKKAGFISKKWFPYFANYRRNGYDFDARYEDELASNRSKKIMDLFEQAPELFSYEAKQQAGFGKGGEKNFDGVVTDLQMQTYLIMSDFQKKVNKKGEPYGWPIAALVKPEIKWGYKYVTGKYSEKPAESWERIVKQIRKHFPGADEKEIRKIVGIKYPGGLK